MKALVYTPSVPRWLACKAIGHLHTGVFWGPLSGLSYREVSEPSLPTPEWVRLRTIMGGICGTDLGIILQKNHPASYLQGMASFPMVLGHENVAVIDELGPKVTGWDLGERVCAEPALSCVSRDHSPRCKPCELGQFSLCENNNNSTLPKGTMIGLNAFTGGSWSPYFVAHHSQLHRIPESINNDEAITTDAVSCSLHGVLRHRPRPTDRVLVVGGGIIGLGVVACLRALDHDNDITAVARYASQEQWLEKLGATRVIRFGRNSTAESRFDTVASETGGTRVDGRFGNHGLSGGFDVVYDCVGSGSSISESMKFTRARGTTVLLGTSQIALVDTTPIWNKEIHIKSGYGRQIETFEGQSIHTYELLFELVKTGKLVLRDLLTHRFPLERYGDAFNTLTTKSKSNVVKAAFIPGG